LRNLASGVSLKQIFRFQSSCEATGLRNRVMYPQRRRQHQVSILLRGNGVAQRPIEDEWFGVNRFNPLARQRGCATPMKKPNISPETRGFNPLARQRGCATFSPTLARTRCGFNPLARQRGCATWTMCPRMTRPPKSVSILLRGNGVAQPKDMSEDELLRMASFNPLARQRGCATVFLAFILMAGIGFNPLARQRGCATTIMVPDYYAGEESFNPLARQRGCATSSRKWPCRLAWPFQSSCEATGLRNPKMLWPFELDTDRFQSSCEATGLRNWRTACIWRASRFRFNPLARQRGCATSNTH